MLKQVTLLFLISIVLFVYFNTTKNTHHKEKYYQKKFCNKLNGLIEYRLKDHTRVDCLTKTYAIEIDFAKKWAESIGQSLFYADMTNKKPAVGLIVDRKDTKFIKRLQRVATKFNIKIFLIEK